MFDLIGQDTQLPHDALGFFGYVIILLFDGVEFGSYILFHLFDFSREEFLTLV